jgi:hypothetical protein
MKDVSCRSSIMEIRKTVCAASRETSSGGNQSSTFLSMKYEYLMRVERRLYYACTMKSVKQNSLGGCNVGVIDGSDL